MDAPVSRLRFVPFEIPTAVSQPPEGEDWIHEVKFDGYRTQLIIERRKIRAYSRRGLDWHSSRRLVGASGQTKYLILQGAEDQIARTENGAQLQKELGEPGDAC